MRGKAYVCTGGISILILGLLSVEIKKILIELYKVLYTQLCIFKYIQGIFPLIFQMYLFFGTENFSCS